MKNILAPSILSADFKILGEQLKLTEEAGAEYIHFDVMDGMFVPSISFGMPVLKSIHNATDQVMDAHLMVQEPIRYVEAFKEAGADIVTIHLEACEDVNATIEKIRECGMKVGLSICPETPVSKVENLLKDIDMLLIMSVHPGFGGQKFIPESLDKIREKNNHKSGTFRRYPGRWRNLPDKCQRSTGCRSEYYCSRFSSI